MAVERVDDSGEPRVDRVRAGFSWQLLDRLHLPVVVTDLEGRILYANPAAQELYGLSRQMQQDGNVLDLLVGDDARAWAGEIMAAVVSGQTWTGEFPIRCAGGIVRRLLVTDTPLIEDGRVVAVMGVAEDVTERVGPRADAGDLRRAAGQASPGDRRACRGTRHLRGHRRRRDARS